MAVFGKSVKRAPKDQEAEAQISGEATKREDPSELEE